MNAPASARPKGAVPTNALLAVLGYGVSTSVGANTPQSLASLRAGVTRFVETDAHLCEGYDPDAEDLEAPKVAPVADVASNAKPVERLFGLGIPALRDAIEQAELSRTEFQAAGLHLVLPAAERDVFRGIESTFAAEFLRRASLPEPVSVEVWRSGSSGFASALAAAAASAARDRRERAIVLTVDSLVDGKTLRALDAKDRLKCSRAPEGIIPGEAAAAFVFGRPSASLFQSKAVRATLDAVGQADERATYDRDEACTGQGLTEAVRSAMRSLQMPPPRPAWVISDQNGERYKSLEWSYVVSRLHQVFGALEHQWYLADVVGELGSAAGGVAAARLCFAFDRGHAPSEQGWLILSADAGGRAAMVFGAPTRGGL